MTTATDWTYGTDADTTPAEPYTRIDARCSCGWRMERSTTETAVHAARAHRRFMALLDDEDHETSVGPVELRGDGPIPVVAAPWRCRLLGHRWAGTGELLRLRPEYEWSPRAMLCRCDRCPAERYTNELDSVTALRAELRYYERRQSLRDAEDRATARAARLEARHG